MIVIQSSCFIFLRYYILDMDRIISRDVPSSVLHERIDKVSQYDPLPVSLRSAVKSGSVRPIKYTDGEKKLYITRVREGSSVVDESEPVIEDSDVVAYTDSNMWFVPQAEASAIDWIPELRQAFHESDGFTGQDAKFRYHFSDNQTAVAVPAPDPVERLDKSITIDGLRHFKDFPQKWILRTTDGDLMYLRERSGQIRLQNGLDRSEDELFNAFIGREHPGTHLEPDEILRIVTAVEYIEMADTVETLPESVLDAYFESAREGTVTSYNDLDVDF